MERSQAAAAGPGPGPGPVPEVCAVCLDVMRDKRTLRCRHSFCSSCVAAAFSVKPACPLCNAYHGRHTGTQPNGTMTVCRHPKCLPGHERCGCFIIRYSFPAGIQGPEHPNPGTMYSGTTRIAYLPANEEGEKILKMLRKAFDRKLIFTVGQSVTTGLQNVITWNDIHHKTNVNGGPPCFGYPDPDYLYRVREELYAKGVREDD
ncbi:unnamed protein product [Ophioblennius macclurei]